MSEGDSSHDTSIDDLSAVPAVETKTEGNSVEAASAQPPADGHPSSNKSAAVEEEPADEPWRKRLWFVRLPAPEQISSGGLQAEVESLKDQVKLLNASSQVKRLERDQVQQLHKQARAQLLVCKESLQQKDEQLRPLREARDEQNKARDALKSSGGEITVKSEEELDAKLQEMHHKQQHESLTSNEEKRLLQQIKTLQASREKVREYAAKASTLATARTAMSSMQGELRSLEAERRQLAEERLVQSKITDKYWKEQQELDAQIEDIFKERRRIKELQDETYAELKGSQQAQRQRSGAYQSNRAFSQQVRKVLRAGHLDEARSMCEQQMDEAIEHLSTNAEARAEYQALWEQQRPRRLEPPAAGPAQGRQEAEQPSKSKATDVIHRALEHAAQTLAKTRSEGNLGSASSGPLVGRGTTVALPSGELPPTVAPAAKPETLSKPSPAQAASSPLKAPAPAKALSAAAPAAALPQQQEQQQQPPVLENGHTAPHKPNGKSKRLDSDTFKVPASLQKSEEVVDEEHRREQARQHNLAAAKEAEVRKQRRAKEKEKKKVRAQEAKAAAKAQAAAPQPAENGTASSGGEEPSMPEPTIPSQEFLLAAAEEAKEPAMVREGAQKRKHATGGKGSKVKPTAPRARPPVRRKGFVRFLKDYQLHLAAGGAALVTAAIGAYAVYGSELQWS